MFNGRYETAVTRPWSPPQILSRRPMESHQDKTPVVAELTANAGATCPSGAEALLQLLNQKLDALADSSGNRERRYGSLKRAAAESDLSIPSLRRLIAAGKLKAYRPIAGKILVDRRELASLIAASTVTRRTGRGKKRKT